MIQGLQFVLVHVPSIAQVRAFYTETLGFTPVADSPTFLQYAPGPEGGATLAFSEESEAQPGVNPELWWFVDDADTTYAELIGKGAPVAAEPKDEPFGRTFAIHDPAGNTLYFLQLRQG